MKVNCYKAVADIKISLKTVPVEIVGSEATIVTLDLLDEIGVEVNPTATTLEMAFGIVEDGVKQRCLEISALDGSHGKNGPILCDEESVNQGSVPRTQEEHRAGSVRENEKP